MRYSVRTPSNEVIQVIFDLAIAAGYTFPNRNRDIEFNDPRLGIFIPAMNFDPVEKRMGVYTQSQDVFPGEVPLHVAITMLVQEAKDSPGPTYQELLDTGVISGGDNAMPCESKLTPHLTEDGVPVVDGGIYYEVLDGSIAARAFHLMADDGYSETSPASDFMLYSTEELAQAKLDEDTQEVRSTEQ